MRRRSDKKVLVLKERRVAELGKRAPADHEANLLRRVARRKKEKAGAAPARRKK